MTAVLPGTAAVRPPAGGDRPPLTGPLLASAAPDLATHERRFGALPWQGGRGGLLAGLEASGLTGRGGAAFPTCRKVATAGRGRRPVVVANGAEGEPASAKDATLLTSVPHLVLDGLQLAAEAVGAADSYVYLKAGPAAASVRRALAERRAAGRDRYPVRVHQAADTFLAGEESALIASLDGRPALPRSRWRPVAEEGLRGRPTLVQNVETLAHVATIARCGSAWFRAAGTPEDPGTFLATVTGAVARPGVVEAPYGLALGDLLELAGGPSGALGGLLVGGYGGAWLPARAVDAPFSRSGLAPWGAAPGAGVVVALPAGSCGLLATARILDYLAGQSAGQCGPCLNGLPQLAATVGRLAAGERDPRSAAAAERLTALVSGRGACHHPDGAARLVRSALRVFADDLAAHLAGYCSATRY